MKKIILKQPLIYLSLLLVMAISFNSCSDDDDDDDAKALLEMYANTTWENSTTFLRIVNDLDVIAESWSDNIEESKNSESKGDDPSSCYVNWSLGGYGMVGITILESSESKFSFKANYGGDFEEIITITIENDNLVLKYNYKGSVRTETYSRSDEDVDALELCDDQ
ncbi:MAG: hypothetical protein KAH07_05605 [Flavobacteriaceae bacterium]|nr:hypothetical protein [Flavobacteriaceae bacterium]